MDDQRTIDAMVGEAIRRERKRLRLKQAEVAEAIGVTQQTIARWESGQRPDLAYAEKIAEFLEVGEEIVVGLFDPITRARMRGGGVAHDPVATIAAVGRDEPRRGGPERATTPGDGDAVLSGKLTRLSPQDRAYVEGLVDRLLGEGSS